MTEQAGRIDERAAEAAAGGARPVAPFPSSLGAPRLASAAPRVQRPTALMRRVEVCWLDAEGTAREATRLIPAIPAFEEAFAAFARGTLFRTEAGPAAVEDLRPGVRVRVADGGWRTLRWRGSTMIVRDAEGRGQDPAMARLTRVAAGALGPGRPDHDLVLGPSARVVRRGAATVLAAGLADGEGVIPVAPAAAVQAYHLGFDGHERLLAQGLEVESYHPGLAEAAPTRPDLMGLWLSCFPHKADLADFGPPALPRASGPEELDGRQA